MTVDRYECCDAQRRTVLTTVGAGTLTGIDYLNVRAGETTDDPTFLDIILVNPLPAATATLTAANIRITGGVRFAPPAIFTVTPTADDPITHYEIEIAGKQPTDFSTYQLAIVDAADPDLPPPFFDPRLATVDFSFKVDCPSDMDCGPACPPPDEPPPPGPAFDFRARDYQGFRQLMLGRLAALVPDFREDDPADFTTMLVEALAYRADQLSYRLDWVGTEAFLTTARSRIALARHARLVDYRIGEGANARVFARFTSDDPAADGLAIEAGTPLLVRADGLPATIGAAAYTGLLRAAPVVFETVAPVTYRAWRDDIAFHTWSDSECVLPRGARAATLIDTSGGASPLAAGDFLLLAEIRSPETLAEADARPERRHVVRLTAATAVKDVLAPALRLVTVEWDEADALPFDLVVQAIDPGALGAAATVICAQASGNMMLADHGASMPPVPHLALTPAETESLRPQLDPPGPRDSGDWRPRLDRGDIARIAPVDLGAAATTMRAVDPAACAPALSLDDDFAVWSARRDLLESGPFSRDFVIETGLDQRATLRFGDGINGLMPAFGTALVVRGRFGGGLAGNIGADALAHVVLPETQAKLGLKVTNPLPAQGGAAKERAADVRINAPVAFRKQERAVTAEDYGEVARRHPEVSNALAVPRWTGAWQTMLVYVDRVGGRPVDAPFRAGLLAHMERYRMMGVDLALRGAIDAPLDLEFFVCAAPEQLRSTVAARIKAALRPAGDGLRHGFFHADRFTFGTALYLSAVIAAIMAVPGVQSVTPHKFQRLGRPALGELAAGVIRPGPFEVLQAEDDPSLPERGRIALVMGGGR